VEGIHKASDGQDSLNVDVKIRSKSLIENLVQSTICPRWRKESIDGALVVAREDGLGSGLFNTMDLLGVSAWFVDTEGLIVDSNESAQQLTGYARQETLGREFAGHLPTPSSKQRASNAVKDAICEGTEP